MLAAGTEVAGFTINGVVGRGGMGVVYRATQAAVGREVALKLLSPELGHDPSFRERFRREGQMQATMNHPNIVPVYEMGDSPEGFFIAMPLIKGPTLKALILDEEIDSARTLHLLRGVAAGLDAAHAAGLIHRDVKPANVLVVGHDQAYLADFGLTKAAGVESLTKTGAVLGTLDYVAPERIRGEATGPSSDIYSLAAVLYECLTGSVPFRRASEVAVIYAHLEHVPPSVREVRRELPRALDRVIRKGMAKRPRDRHATAGALIDDAARALGPAAADRPLPPPVAHPRTRPAAARRGEEEETGTVQEDVIPTLLAPRRVRRPPRPRPTRGRLLAVAAIPLALAAAFLIGLSGHKGTAVAVAGPTRTLTDRGATLRVPQAWESGPAAPTVLPGIFKRPPLVVHPAGAGGSELLFGRAIAYDPELLPAALVRSVNVVGSGQPVRVGDGEALEYARLRTRDGRHRVTLFLLPTSRNVVTLACVDDPVLSRCPRVASTLRLSGIVPFSLGARGPYQAFLLSTLGQLRRALPPELRALRRARTVSAQSAAARRLAAAYQRAADRFTAYGTPTRGEKDAEFPVRTPSPGETGVHFLIRDSLRGLASTYRELAAAAGRPGAYVAAGASVQTAVRELAASLDQLGKVGFVITSGR